ESLECRALPSMITVLNDHDSGAGSLREAIANAQSGDTIDFASSLAGQTITLTTGELVLDKSLDIEVLGSNRLAVSGHNASRVFAVKSSVTVTIEHLAITHGRADNGGGVLSVGAHLSLGDVVVSDNQALAAPGQDAFGGGVYNQGGHPH